jgi:hypothetical protein
MITQKPRKHYVNNPDFYQAIIVYKAKKEIDPNTKVSDYIGVCILQICEKLSTKYNFSGYTFLSDMVGDGIENCIAAVDNFNPDRTNNPFAYFTQIAWNAFIRRITKESKETYIKHKNMQTYFTDVNLSAEMSYGDGGTNMQMKNNDLSNEVIRNFEKKLTKAKKTAIIGLDKFANETEKEFDDEYE